MQREILGNPGVHDPSGGPAPDYACCCCCCARMPRSRDGRDVGVPPSLALCLPMSDVGLRSRTNTRKCCGRPPHQPTLAPVSASLSSITTASPAHLPWQHIIIPCTCALHGPLSAQVGSSHGNVNRLGAVVSRTGFGPFGGAQQPDLTSQRGPAERPPPGEPVHASLSRQLSFL